MADLKLCFVTQEDGEQVLLGDNARGADTHQICLAHATSVRLSDPALQDIFQIAGASRGPAETG
jgi:hypothetical protein